jgi:hypothetical protein
MAAVYDKPIVPSTRFEVDSFEHVLRPEHFHASLDVIGVIDAEHIVFLGEHEGV